MELFGDKVSVVGEIAFPITRGPSQEKAMGHAALLKIEHPGGWVGFAVQGLEANEAGKAYVSERVGRRYIMPRGRVTLGRSADYPYKAQEDASLVSAESLWGAGAKYDDVVSRRHAEVRVGNGAMSVRDLGSHSGTLIKRDSYTEHTPDDEDDYVAAHTVKAIKLAEWRKLLSRDRDGRMLFAGRRIVNRDTTLGGPNPEATVDIRAWVAGGEAIVVDPTEDSGEYDKLLNSFFGRIAKYKGKYDEEDVLKAIYDTVSGAMQYSLAYADWRSEWINQQSPDHRKINLDVYLAAGKGVCRHMALAAAWLGGEAAARGLLSGRLTAPVKENTAYNAAHEWARYTAKDGRVYILDMGSDDPNDHYFGTLEASTVRKNAQNWNYFEPGEREDYMRRFGHLAHQQLKRNVGRGAVRRFFS